MAVVKRVAVVGAGASGLTSVKTCLEAGLEVVGFERADEVGGLWHFTEKVHEGVSCVNRSTFMNTSKELSGFSDFPMPKEFPVYLHHKQVVEYFRSYCDHFDLDRHIRYSTEVTRVSPAQDYAETGRWVISTIDHKSGRSQTETFDAVLVASGHHAERNMPDLPGLDEFQGPVLHTKDYRPDPLYQDKKILVVGFGNSAGDMAVELSGVGEQVYLSTRRGSWVFHCYMAGGMPFDLQGETRYQYWKNGILPFSWVETMMAATLNRAVDHDLYGLTPDCMPLSHSPFLNNELVSRLLCGAVKLKGDIKRFTRTGVEFKDGTCQNIDVVMMATGYIIGYPFIDKEVLDIKDNKVMFYRHMFHPDLQHQTMAFIGCIQPTNCLWPICELQARVATAVFTGQLQLPSRQDMWEVVRQRHEASTKRYANTPRHTIEVDFVSAMDELAEMIGCKPNLKRLLLKDPQLAVKAFFGPCVPYQYRLEGPNAWTGAREATMSAMDRMRYPLQCGRSLPANRPQNLIKVTKWLMYPPTSWVFFLEAVVVVLLLLLLLG